MLVFVLIYNIETNIVHYNASFNQSIQKINLQSQDCSEPYHQKNYLTDGRRNVGQPKLRWLDDRDGWRQTRSHKGL